MNFRQLRNNTVFAAAATAAVYSLAVGKGPFNRMRFKEQHDALSKYVDNNYPDCAYTPITIHGRGWASKVKRRGQTIRFIYFSKSAEGVYVFTESAQKSDRAL